MRSDYLPVLKYSTALSNTGSLPSFVFSSVSSTFISGVSPPSEMEVPDGVSQRATVTLSDEPLGRSTSSCTDPLPNDDTPTSVAYPCSWSAPARISEAEAEPPSISTTISFGENCLSVVLKVRR